MLHRYDLFTLHTELGLHVHLLLRGHTHTTVVLKLENASELPRWLVKTQIAGSHLRDYDSVNME